MIKNLIIVTGTKNRFDKIESRATMNNKPTNTLLWVISSQSQNPNPKQPPSPLRLKKTLRTKCLPKRSRISSLICTSSRLRPLCSAASCDLAGDVWVLLGTLLPGAQRLPS